MDNAGNEVVLRVGISRSGLEIGDRLFFFPMTSKVIIYYSECLLFLKVNVAYQPSLNVFRCFRGDITYEI